MKRDILNSLYSDIMKEGMLKIPFRLPSENKYIVDGERKSIIDADWDFLVILDTCRYDVFEKVYRVFFIDGTLKKALSPACWTREWLVKSFPDRYDNIIFISGNANANSKIVMNDGGFKFYAKEHFFKVVDVWDFGWDNSVGQVPPNEINKAFEKWYMRYPNKRFILHYMQPHQPWINIGGEPQKKHIIMKNTKKSEYSKARNLLRNVPEEYWWKIRKIFGIEPNTIIEKYYQKNGRKGMIEGYTKELMLGLLYVSKLIEKTNGKWLITADHGELLGEGGWYGHPVKHRIRKQVEVPWFEISKNV